MTTRISDSAALPNHWLEEIEVVGLYKARRVKTGQGMNYVAVLQVGEGPQKVLIDLFDRPTDEAERLNGAQVVVAGELQPPIDADVPLYAAARDDLPAIVAITSISPV